MHKWNYRVLKKINVELKTTVYAKFITDVMEQ